MNTHNYLLFVFLFSCAGCSSLSINLPYGRLESPETNGQWRVRAKVGVEPSHRMMITADASDRPEPELDEPDHDPASIVAWGFGVGLTEFLDVSLKTGISLTSILDFDVPIMVQGKIQALGDNHRESDKGNFSLAFSAATGTSTTTESGDQDGQFGDGGHDWEATASTSVADIALILGYRINPKILLYGGGYLTRYWVQTNIEHEEADDGDFPKESYEVRNHGDVRGFNFGFQFDFTKVVGLMLEANHMTFEWSHDHVPGYTDLQGGIAFIVTFPK